MAIAGIYSSLSGVAAFEKKWATTAHNIANLETNGFKAQRASMEETATGGVKVSLTRDRSPGPLVSEPTSNGGVLTEKSNVDVSRELGEMIIAKNGYAANLRLIRTEDEMLGNLLDAVG
jgi:flagellar basal body rod protein FlgG